jgi:hypothetical protein
MGYGSINMDDLMIVVLPGMPCVGCAVVAMARSERALGFAITGIVLPVLVFVVAMVIDVFSMALY